MTNRENLYIVAENECFEIAKAISKIIRYGEHNYDPMNPIITNERRLLIEYYQLQAVMNMLMDKGYIERPILENIDSIAVEDVRKTMVEHYRKKSEDLGIIKEES